MYSEMTMLYFILLLIPVTSKSQSKLCLKICFLTKIFK